MKWPFAALAVAASLSWAAAARADRTAELEALLNQTVVSTASKAPQIDSVAPATSVTLTAEDLRRYGIRSLDEAINFLVLGMVIQNPLRPSEIGARGVLFTGDGGEHVLLLVNGHALNDPWSGNAYFGRGTAVPLELIDHIEVILGPGSVVYGSNAMLGVINVVTKRAKDYAGLHVVFESEIPTSYRVATGIGKEFRLFGKPAEVTFQAEYYTQSGPVFTFGPQNGDSGTWGGRATNSYYTRLPSFYARLFAGDFEVNVRAATYRHATPYLNLVNLASGDFNDPNSFELDRWISLDVKHSARLSSWVQLTTRLYGDLYDYEQLSFHSTTDECLDDQAIACSRRLKGASQWVGLEPNLTLDWLHDGSMVTQVGADARVQHYSSSLTDTETGNGTPPESVYAYGRVEKTLGVALQQVVRPTKWLHLNAGVRLDVYEGVGSKLSPRLALAASPWKGATFKGIYSEAFRAPDGKDRFVFDPEGQVPAVNLQPESVRSVEASFEQRLGAHRVFLNAFRTWWSNVVVLEQLDRRQLRAAIAAGQLESDVTSAIQYRNAESLDNYGFGVTVEGSALSRQLHYGFNFTGAYARRSFTDGRPSQPLSAAPQVFGNARLAYDLGGGLPTIALATHFLGAQPADRAFDGHFTPTPYAPPQLDLRVTLSGGVPKVHGLSYRLSADYALASQAPYVVGPVQSATLAHPAAQLAPVDQFRTAIGLAYDLPF